MVAMSEYIDPATIDTGSLDVGDGHTIYWERWGNPDATPIVHLHGGPGSGHNDGHKDIYDPAVHQVIFHDQRGCGRSTPLGETTNNTTQKLIEDIDRLAATLDVPEFHVAGGSWGSTLALTYAIHAPEKVRSLLVWGIYLGSQFETDWVNEGYPRHTYPEAWEQFIGMVPEEARTSGAKTMAYYSSKVNGDDPDEALRYAQEWTKWEASIMSLGYDKAAIEREIMSEEDVITGAKMELHYFENNCFLEPDYILRHLDIIKGITCAIVNGRFDMCTPPVTAIELAKQYGKNATLQIVSSGHRRTDRELAVALKAQAQRLFH